MTKPTKCGCTLGLLTPLTSFFLAEKFRWCGAASIASRNERALVLARFVVADFPCLFHLLLCWDGSGWQKRWLAQRVKSFLEVLPPK